MSGAVLTGFGAGGFIFTKLGTALINPKNLQAKAGFFPDSVRRTTKAFAVDSQMIHAHASQHQSH